MEKDKIILKKKIDTFLANSLDSIDYSQFKVDSVIHFPLTKSHNIKIENNITFSFQFDIFNTKVYRASKADFEYYGIDVEILNELEIKFNLIKKAKLNKDYFSLHFREPSDFGTCNIAFQKDINHFFLIIYSSKRSREAQSPAEDMYGDNILYIYGIWEVELSEEFKKKVFGENV